MIKEIVIRTPIWKTNSVGINIGNLADDDSVKISISHRTADGNLYHPFSYVVNVVDVKKYPIAFIKGGHPLHDIPIDDLWIISKKTESIKLNN